ncbi:RNA-binding protein 25-like [Heteronotia binoei]|uniref:RNA-binding protein 25-like n=1 Tax=Heteronotia binoei TaxID=13085 RepID=UPI00292F522D|nr:RNA-binding protein 25-like [Heteronotia binoei]
MAQDSNLTLIANDILQADASKETLKDQVSLKQDDNISEHGVPSVPSGEKELHDDLPQPAASKETLKDQASLKQDSGVSEPGVPSVPSGEKEQELHDSKISLISGGLPQTAASKETLKDQVSLKQHDSLSVHSGPSVPSGEKEQELSAAESKEDTSKKCIIPPVLVVPAPSLATLSSDDSFKSVKESEDAAEKGLGGTTPPVLIEPELEAPNLGEEEASHAASENDTPDKLHSLLNCQVCQLFVRTVDRLLDKTEEAMDHFMPLTEEEISNLKQAVEDMDTSPDDRQKKDCLERITALSSRLRQQAYMMALGKLRLARRSTQSNLSHLHLTIDLIEHAQQDAEPEVKRSHVMLNEICARWSQERESTGDLQPSKQEERQSAEELPPKKEEERESVKELPPEKEEEKQSAEELPPDKEEERESVKDLPSDKEEERESVKDLPSDKEEERESVKDLPSDKEEERESVKDLPSAKEEERESVKDLPSAKEEERESVKDLLPDKEEEKQSAEELPPDKEEERESVEELPPDKEEEQRVEELPPDKEEERQSAGELPPYEQEEVSALSGGQIEAAAPLPVAKSAVEAEVRKDEIATEAGISPLAAQKRPMESDESSDEDYLSDDALMIMTVPGCREEHGFRTPEVESKTLEMSRTVTLDLLSTYKNLLATLKDLPLNLKRKLNQSYQHMAELHARFSMARSFADIPGSILAKGLEIMVQAQESMDEVMEFAFQHPLSLLGQDQPLATATPSAQEKEETDILKIQAAYDPKGCEDKF